MKKCVAIIGSHGLYANYGGWDQLVNNLAERKSDDDLSYLIFNSKESSIINNNLPKNVTVRFIKLNASGFEGLIYDFWTIFLCYFKVDCILLLGVQGIPLVALLKIFKKTKIVSNVGGIEWERPKFSFFAKVYLKMCFYLSFIFSDSIVLDNEHYLNFAPNFNRNRISIIPYGGIIDFSLENSTEFEKKFPFIGQEFFLSISRALEDNQIYQLCEAFQKSEKILVLISNFSSSDYGKRVFEKFKNDKNIFLINGLYNKKELDLIRRKCKAYIHTHTLCGTAPSLVEMIISRVPIISFDVPQNKFTLLKFGIYFSNFTELISIVNGNADFSSAIPPDFLLDIYDWNKIVNRYQSLF
jgi:hypothetical protein